MVIGNLIALSHGHRGGHQAPWTVLMGQGNVAEQGLGAIVMVCDDEASLTFQLGADVVHAQAGGQALAALPRTHSQKPAHHVVLVAGSFTEIPEHVMVKLRADCVWVVWDALSCALVYNSCL
jgi:hypothetical protein